jgi:hypothetical protein
MYGGYRRVYQRDSGAEDGLNPEYAAAEGTAIEIEERK